MRLRLLGLNKNHSLISLIFIIAVIQFFHRNRFDQHTIRSETRFDQGLYQIHLRNRDRRIIPIADAVIVCAWVIFWRSSSIRSWIVSGVTVWRRSQRLLKF
jgi:hypothetical protein